METTQFETIVNIHSLAPGNVLYNSNALTGEAGECANMVKKIVMANMRPEWVTQNENRLPDASVFVENLKVELSDVLFYLTRLALDNGVTLNDLMMMQLQKLSAQSDKYKRTFLK